MILEKLAKNHAAAFTGNTLWLDPDIVARVLFFGADQFATTDTCSNCYLITAKRPVPVAGPAALTFNPIPGLTLLEILFLILLPSLVFSILAMRWARTRTGAGEHPFE